MSTETGSGAAHVTYVYPPPRPEPDASLLCNRGVGGCVLALRHEERRLKQRLAEVNEQKEVVSLLDASESELQAAVRLASAIDNENVVAQTQVLCGKAGLQNLRAAAKVRSEIRPETLRVSHADPFPLRPLRCRRQSCC